MGWKCQSQDAAERDLWIGEIHRVRDRVFIVSLHRHRHGSARAGVDAAIQRFHRHVAAVVGGDSRTIDVDISAGDDGHAALRRCINATDSKGVDGKNRRAGVDIAAGVDGDIAAVQGGYGTGIHVQIPDEIPGDGGSVGVVSGGDD